MRLQRDALRYVAGVVTWRMGWGTEGVRGSAPPEWNEKESPDAASLRESRKPDEKTIRPAARPRSMN